MIAVSVKQPLRQGQSNKTEVAYKVHAMIRPVFCSLFCALLLLLHLHLVI